MSLGSKTNLRGCSNCGAATVGQICDVCGFLQNTSSHFTAEITLDRMHVFHLDDQMFEVVHPLSASRGATRYLVQDGSEQRWVVVAFSDEDALAQLNALRARFGDLFKAPIRTGFSGGGPVEMYEYAEEISVAGVISRAVTERQDNDAVELIERWFFPLIKCVERVHSAAYHLRGSRPDGFAFGADGICRLSMTAAPCPLESDDGADHTGASGERAVVAGFAAPELYGRCGAQVGQRADVYFLGCVLYSLLSRVAPFRDCARHVNRLPTARLFHEEVPPMLDAVARRATSPSPFHRYESALEMGAAVRNALNLHKLRRAQTRQKLAIDIGHEIHIGLVKGLYSPVNQDDYFLHYDGISGTGVFFVTDGVSISHFGTGDQASRCVREAAQACSKRITASIEVNSVDDTLALSEVDIEVSEALLPGGYAERCKLLADVLNEANAAIGQTVSPLVPQSPEVPPGIMAATAVGLLLDQNEATFTFIGDSRIYLVRDGHLAQLSVDHNFSSQLMRNGRSPTASRQVSGANALVRCVGDFDRGSDGGLVAVPLAPEFSNLRILPGDYLVLCSDGVVDYAGFNEESAENRIIEIVESAPNARTAAFELMVAANRGGGGDNICCIVLGFEEESGEGFSS